MIEGNDDRGIDIAVLVKKDLPFDLEMQSYRNAKMHNERNGGSEELVFSRDLPVLKVMKKGSKEPLSLFMGVHLKSQRDAPNDPRSVYKRTQQAAAVTRIYQDYRRMHPEAPVFLLGDFNAEIGAPEFRPLWEAGFKDSFDLAPNTPHDRITHSYHPNSGENIYGQLDAVVVAEGKAKGIIKSGEVVPYLDPDGNPKALPASKEERKENPSDHRMVNVVVDFRKVKTRPQL
jgi:hypothetical protein